MSVVEISASYHLFPIDAELTLSSQITRGTVLTILHERFGGDVTTYDFAESFQQAFAVRSGESLIIIARTGGHVIGALVNEIDADETARVLLRPKGGFNLIVYQSRQDDPAPKDLTLNFTTQTSQPPTPATLLLSKLLRATMALYRGREQTVPGPLAHLVQPVGEAIEANEEEYSREMLGYLCVVLEELGLAKRDGVARFYGIATSIPVRP